MYNAMFLTENVKHIVKYFMQKMIDYHNHKYYKMNFWHISRQEKKIKYLSKRERDENLY